MLVIVRCEAPLHDSQDLVLVLGCKDGVLCGCCIRYRLIVAIVDVGSGNIRVAIVAALRLLD